MSKAQEVKPRCVSFPFSPWWMAAAGTEHHGAKTNKQTNKNKVNHHHTDRRNLLAPRFRWFVVFFPLVDVSSDFRPLDASVSVLQWPGATPHPRHATPRHATPDPDNWVRPNTPHTSPRQRTIFFFLSTTEFRKQHRTWRVSVSLLLLLLPLKDRRRDPDNLRFP